MLRNFRGILGSTILATGGSPGRLHDLLFDDRIWIVRHLVVETGRWFSSRRVLIPPCSVERLGWGERSLRVELSASEVRQGPGADSARPVSRQEQIAMSRPHAGSASWSMDPPLLPAWLGGRTRAGEGENDPYLRSAREITTYHAVAGGREAGRVNDLILDDTHWEIRYLVVLAGRHRGGRRLLLSTPSIRHISWARREVRYILSQDEN
ncbi:MAG: hypothetical protein IT160_10920 [Bryobacterales bacterium]|nr:hypothetical protein [Bryobacterales bacterium]